jgi:miniconductance mechanosensitive channel
MVDYLMKFDKYFEHLLTSYGLTQYFASVLNMVILCAIIAVLAMIANFILKQIIIKIIKRWVDKSPNTYDDIFYEKGVFNKLSHLGPALIIYNFSPVPLSEFPRLLEFVHRSANVYIAIIVMVVLFSILNALHEIFNNTPVGKQRSIKGYVQAVKFIIYFIGSLAIISILIDYPLGDIFLKLGAFAAVLMFVFKDAILGLMAGIQISSYEILRIGDYIEMPHKNVDGTVIDIKLSVVKVLNANKTVSTIPTYAFVSEAFWNWRGLELSDGRRLKRSINIDISTIKHCTEKELSKFKKIALLKEYFETKEGEFGAANEENLFHGKAYTNSSLFRAYVEAYLKNNTLVLTDMTFMVRHMQPTEHGLPIEIYVYIKEKNGAKFETIQSDIFDHIIAIMPEFGLKIFQKPTGDDIRKS